MRAQLGEDPANPTDEVTKAYVDGLVAGLGSGGGTATWGGITGTLSSQTDLQSALNAKVPTTRTVNGHALSANVTVTASDVGAATSTDISTAITAERTAVATVTHKNLADATNTFPTFNQSTTGNAATATALATPRNINGVAFDGTGNVTINAVDATARVPTTTTVNGHALSGNVTVTNSDLGAVPTTTTVNGHALSANVTVTASDIGAVPTTTTVNGHALSGNVTVTASDVGAATSSDISSAITAERSATRTLTNTTLNGTTMSDTLDMNGNVISRLAQIYDDNFNLAFEIGAPAGTIVNHFQVFGSTTGVNPTVSVVGETNAGLNFGLNGTGRLTANSVNVPTVSSTDVLTHKDLTDATNTFPTLNQSTTGNAATATKLATARAINGVNFDGSGPITINAVDSTARVATTTTVNGHALSSNVTVTASDVSALASSLTISTLNTAITDAEVVVGSVNGTATALTLWTGTSAQYTALGSYSSTTVYIVTA